MVVHYYTHSRKSWDQGRSKRIRIGTDKIPEIVLGFVSFVSDPCPTE
jgi:hypothetical protein